jgi:hypothetical protein
MNRHVNGIIGIIAIMLIALGVAALIGSPILTLMAILGAVTVAFVMGIAWMRERPSAQSKDPPAPDDRFDSLRQR